MKKNMGNTDRIIRIAFAIIVAILFLFNIINGTLAYTLIIIAGVLLLTGVINFCPLYRVLGVNTCKIKK